MVEIDFAQILMKWLRLHHLARLKESLGSEDFLL